MNSSKDSIQRHSVINKDLSFSLNQIFALVFAFGALMAMGWLDNGRGPIFPLIIGDLNLSHSQGSLFFALASLTAVGANFMVPRQIKYLGSKGLLLVGVLILALFPLVLLWSETFSGLLLSAFVFGWSMGTIGVTQNIVIEESVPSHKKRTYLSLLHSVYGLSALLAPVLIGQILAFGYSWRESFTFVLFFIFPVLCFGFLSLRSQNRNSQTIEISLNGNLNDNFNDNLSDELNDTLKDKLNDKLSMKLLSFWGLILALYVSCELFFSTRLVMIFHKHYSRSLQDSNFQLTLFFVGLFIGRVLVSFLPHRFSSRKVIQYSLFFTAATILVGVFVSAEFFFLIGFTLSPIFPLSMDEISNQTGYQFKEYSSVIIALSSIGVVTMHIMAGLLADVYGLMWAIVLPLFFVVVALIWCLFYWPEQAEAKSVF